MIARPSGAGQQACGHIDFRKSCSSGKIFYSMAIGVPRDKIHVAVTEIAPQQPIDWAHTLKKRRPVERRRQPHAGDDVAHGNAHRRLLLMLGMHDIVGGRALGGQTFIEPQQHRAHVRVQVAESLDQLHGKRGGQRLAFNVPENGDRWFLGQRRPSQQTVCQRVCFQPCGTALYDSVGQPTKVLHQHDAQRNRHRPQFADGQGLHTLIGHDKPAQRFWVEAAVGMGDERPGHSEDSRIILQMAGGQFRQLSVIPGRKVVDNLAELFVHDVKIIYQPLGRGGNRLFLLNRTSNRPIGLHQGPAVLQHPSGE